MKGDNGEAVGIVFVAIVVSGFLGLPAWFLDMAGLRETAVLWAGGAFVVGHAAVFMAYNRAWQGILTVWLCILVALGVLIGIPLGLGLLLDR